MCRVPCRNEHFFKNRQCSIVIFERRLPYASRVVQSSETVHKENSMRRRISSENRGRLYSACLRVGLAVLVCIIFGAARASAADCNVAALGVPGVTVASAMV